MPECCLGTELMKGPTILSWNTTYSCNLKCPHCYASATDELTSGQLTTEEGLEFIDTLGRYDNLVLVFSGGEPLVRSANATSDLRDMLKDTFDVTELHVYEMVPLEIEREALKDIDVILVTAGSVAKALQPHLEHLKQNNAVLVSIGPMATRTMTGIGMIPDVEASINTMEGMLYALIDYLYHQEKK